MEELPEILKTEPAYLKIREGCLPRPGEIAKVIGIEFIYFDDRSYPILCFKVEYPDGVVLPVKVDYHPFKSDIDYDFFPIKPKFPT